jgi:hypothetical protein
VFYGSHDAPLVITRMFLHSNVLTALLQLRDIEILAQQQIETLEADGKDDETLREIQKILYSTEVFTFPVPMSHGLNS